MGFVTRHAERSILVEEADHLEIVIAHGFIFTYGLLTRLVLYVVSGALEVVSDLAFGRLNEVFAVVFLLFNTGFGFLRKEKLIGRSVLRGRLSFRLLRQPLLLKIS